MNLFNRSAFMMPRRAQAVTVFLGLLLALTLLGGCASDDDSAVSGDAVVTSPDGIATLAVPAGALPDGVAVADLSLEVAYPESDEPGMPVVVVGLSPDGIELSSPGTLAVEVGESASGGAVVVHRSGDYIKFLEAASQQTETGSAVIVAVDHFSSVTIYRTPDGTFDMSAAVSPVQVSVDQDQKASGKLKLLTETIGLQLHYASDPEGSTRFTRLLLHTPRESGAVGFWPHGYGKPWPNYNELWHWERVSGTLTKTNSGWDAAIPPSRCQKTNKGDFTLTQSLNVQAEILEVSDLVLHTDRAFASALSGSNPDSSQANVYGIKLDDVSPGALFDARINAFAVTPTECVVLATSSSSNSSTTSGTNPPSTTSSSSTTSSTPDLSGVKPGQDPRAHITGVTAVTTADGTVGLIVTFAQPWGPEPPLDLFSFFFLLNLLRGDLSMTAGWEIHGGNVTALGPGPTYLLDDGSVFIDTGFPVGPGSVGITGQSGSWVDESTTQPVFEDFVFDVATDGAPMFDPSRAVYDLVSQEPMNTP
jgi:hypothetical protein